MRNQPQPSAAPASQTPAPGPAETIDTAEPGSAAKPSGDTASLPVAGLDLEGATPRERALAEQRFRKYQAAVDKKVAAERAELEMARKKAAEFDALLPTLRDPRVMSAIGQVENKPEWIDPRYANPEETGETPIEVPLSEFTDDPAKAINWTIKRTREETRKDMKRELEAHVKHLEARFGGEVSRLHEHTRQQEYEKLAVGYADDPEIEANREDVLALARKGLGMRQAFYAVNGETLAERRRVAAEEKASEKVERAQKASQDPRTRIQKALATSRPKGGFKNAGEALAWAESLGVGAAAGA